jgi:multicomponent Na+:H+ antiporter subunit B
VPERYLWLLDRVLTPVLFVLAVVLLLVGHNAPGGGFIAGLVVAAGLLLQIIARGDNFVRKLIGPYLQPLMGVGLFIAVASAAIGAVHGGFFKGVWWTIEIGEFAIDLGTPTFFDIGVFLVVLSVVTSYILELSRTEEERIDS